MALANDRPSVSCAGILCCSCGKIMLSDGLNQPWRGRIFVNPPYGAEGGQSLSGAFFQKAKQQFSEGNATEIVLLLKAAIGYAWFEPVLQCSHAWLLKRIAFVAEGQLTCHSNPHGSIVVYLGPNAQHFYEVFKPFACVPGGNSWSLSRHAQCTEPTPDTQA